MPATLFPLQLSSAGGVNVKGLLLNSPGVQNSTYTAVIDDVTILVDTNTAASSVTIDLTNIETDKKAIIIIDMSGQAHTYPINITGTSFFGKNNINTSYGVVGYTFSASAGGWLPIIEQSTRAGYIANTSFTGTPLTATVTFVNSLPNQGYAITVTGEDSRAWSVTNKSTSGFDINSNSSVALAGNVYWSVSMYST